MTGYRAALAVGISGAALLLFGILASTDAAFVGGIVLGVVVIAAGAMLAVETARDRRWSIEEPDRIEGRSLDVIRQRADHSGEIRARRGHR